MTKALFINANKDGYVPSECGSTLTVEELIELLEDYEEEMPVYLRFDNGYTYGSISHYDVVEAEDVGEFLGDYMDEEEDLEPVYINANNNGYVPGQCGSTLTVEELIELLEDHEEGRPVYLRIDNGYTYGSISYGDIIEDIIEAEELD